MQTLKIIKIKEGIFKHILVEDSGIEHVFYNTEETKLSIDLGTISISSAGQNRNFINENIEVYDVGGVKQLPTPTLDDLVVVLDTLAYPLLVKKISLAPATGGATEAKQDAGNNTLAAINAKLPPKWDEVTPTFNTTSDVYVYRLAGEVVQTTTITYTDTTKSVVQTITKM